MNDKFRAYAAVNKGEKLKPFEFDPGVLKDEEVEIAVEYCGVCHSDLSMLENEWGMTAYPLVPGHEVVGQIVAVGDHVTARRVGQRVGLGWFSGSCMSCSYCLSGNHNLCTDPERNESTIVHRHGGFANRVRAQWVWATPLPESLDYTKAGPLFCGGITVFNPIVQNGVKPTDRVGVIGIGGLGHMALAFLNRWGCDVTAFTSSDSRAGRSSQVGRASGGQHAGPGAAPENRWIAQLHPLHRQRYARLAGVHRGTRTARTLRHGRHRRRADTTRRVSTDCRPEGVWRLTLGKPFDCGEDDRILCSACHCTGDGEFQDVRRKRGGRASPGGKSPLPDRADKRHRLGRVLSAIGRHARRRFAK